MADANGGCFQQRPQVKPEAKNSARAKPQAGPRQNASKTTRQAPSSSTDPAAVLKKTGQPPAQLAALAPLPALDRFR